MDNVSCHGEKKLLTSFNHIDGYDLYLSVIVILIVIVKVFISVQSGTLAGQ